MPAIFDPFNRSVPCSAVSPISTWRPSLDLMPRPRRPVPVASRPWCPPPLPVPPLADQEAAIAAELARAGLV